ncbi:MAG: hypothetical protein AAF682_19925 [Planctomycetota bacterium]
MLPPGVGPSLVGMTAYHAAMTLTGGAVTAASNPLPATFVP